MFLRKLRTRDVGNRNPYIFGRYLDREASRGIFVIFHSAICLLIIVDGLVCQAATC